MQVMSVGLEEKKEHDMTALKTTCLHLTDEYYVIPKRKALKKQAIHSL